MDLKKPRGTEDLFGAKAKEYIAISTIIRDVMSKYNFDEIITPVFESADLFKRGVGDLTDIVQKEMYEFLDRKGRSLALRPEGTAPVIRSVIENKLVQPENLPLKLFYIGKYYRYERPQIGRNREFNQCGVEVFGKKSPEADAEIITLAITILRSFGFKTNDLSIDLNYLISGKEKLEYISELKKSLLLISNLCDDCKNRIDTNILRVLDCKVDQDKLKSVPTMNDFMSQEDKDWLKVLVKLLNLIDIKTVLNPKLVRGLDYYTGMVFEIKSTHKTLASQSTLCGGGRYDKLLKQLGGPDVSGLGFGMGIERVLLDLDSMNIKLSPPKELDAYIIGLTPKAKQFSTMLLMMLRSDGLIADFDFQDRNIKSAFKQSEKLNARNIIIIGDNELKENVVVIKNQQTKRETKVVYNEIVKTIRGK
ncbi:histidyl-tRNA synthetase [Spiroplasma sp. TIUS-1]|uniref:histidine--tRNA ligase n=1 Tax=Spiroplasma sp. TIUS-1 TaxID=216963 RepID=UPI001397AE58|nr:histidine--tRNA ligase [Spiroplasma sp. TIUS-1]QHX35943.1 histidyl-tRNA synthetase [Spiroplasma sp. TIUS-1]